MQALADENIRIIDFVTLLQHNWQIPPLWLDQNDWFWLCWVVLHCFFYLLRSHTIEYFLSLHHLYLWVSNIMKPRTRIKQFHWICSYTFLWVATNEWTCQTFMTEGHNGAGSEMVIRLLAPCTKYLKWQLWHLQNFLNILLIFHFANLENFQLRNSRIFPDVIDIFSEANNRLTFKQSHKAQAFPIPIHVAASKESCVIVCSQRKIFHKWSFFSNCASSREVLRGLVPNNGQVA